MLPDMDVVEVGGVDEARRAEVSALVDRADAATGHPPLPEPQLLAVAHGVHPVEGSRVVLAREGGRLRGCALLTPARDGSTVVHVVDPEGVLADALTARALAEAGTTGPVQLWAMRAGPDDDARAVRYGFRPERDILQLRVRLPLSRQVLDGTRHLRTRPFVPGRDEAAWLHVNNRAFAGHPEQGSWTLRELRDRLAAAWVDLDGFLLADDPDGDGLIGSCWTKIHRGRKPVLGEIYVIAVDPRHEGHGWGRALTVAGLSWLTGRGVQVGMLYADATNEAALALYRSLGFTLDHVDRAYRRDALGDAALS